MDNRFARRSAGAGDFCEGNRMDRYDPYTDKFLRDTQYNIHGTNLAEVGTDCSEFPNNSDAISRQSVIDVLDETKRIARQNIDGAVLMTFERVLDSLVNITNALPTIQPAEPKKGKWIKTARWGRVYYCNQCRNYLDFDGVNAGRGSTNFCPNCGAKMEVNNESN